MWSLAYGGDKTEGMDDLPLLRLRRRVQELAGALNLRPTLDRAGELGGVLAEAKGLVGHGNWQRWLRSAGLSPRVAQLYMQVSKANPDSFSSLGERVTIRQFLGLIRRSRREGKAAERAEIRERAAGAKGRLPPEISLKRADCRTFKGWPSTVDCIATDPPWRDDAAYQWVAAWASRSLGEGGVLMCQCGSRDLEGRLRSLADAGLTYQWTLAMVFSEGKLARNMVGTFGPSWLPIMVFSKGKMKTVAKASDVYTVRSGSHKTYHDWQQPLAPWVYWIERLVPPGSLICDPFAGAATIGVAVREVGGGRRYLGTEVNPQSYRVARGRLLGGDTTEEG